jgi:hypothetical protein
VIRFVLAARLALALLIVAPGPAKAQMHHHHAAADTTTAASDSTRVMHEMPGIGAMPGMDMSGMDMSEPEHDHGMVMTGLYGPYPMTREASGTSWQPDQARHQGIHRMHGAWTLMLHGMADVVHDHQGGPRGDDKVYSDNMAMLMAQRRAGPGTLGIRAMLSAEPVTIGKEGYPLLLQTGETADGRTPLIDRQHPHDLFMELAGSYSLSRGSRSLFLYAGLPGEPALGPPAFMHRFSGMYLPVAPITHHWLDSSHITFGVVTLGGVQGPLKLEASGFRGREPDEHRFDIESPRLDSYAFRASLNPAPAWAFQVSRGRLNSPEQLEPAIDVDRTTASVVHAMDWMGGHWESTLAWGRNRNRPGRTLDGWLAESAVELRGRHTLFARLERVEKDELFPETDLRAGTPFGVGEISAGYRYDFRASASPRVGIGVMGTAVLVPVSIRDVYGKDPTAWLLFTRIAL